MDRLKESNEQCLWKNNFNLLYDEICTICGRFFPYNKEDLSMVVIQNIYVKKELSTITSLKAYARRAAVNYCLTYAKKRRELLVLDDSSRNFQLKGTSSLKGVELSIDLAYALSFLTDRQAKVIQLRIQGFTVKEIAAELGITPGSARGLLARSRIVLRQFL